MVLRLVTGKHKGRVLSSSATAKELRPTQAIVREAIINVLNSYFLEHELCFEDFHLLDLYSGSGSMGLEFLSNNLAHVCFVDYDPKCLKLLRENTQNLDLEQFSRILAGKLPGVLKKLEPRSFNMLFCDPPFKISIDDYLKTFEFVLKNDLLENKSLLIMEYKNKELAIALAERFSEKVSIFKTKSYGDCEIIFAQLVLPS